MDIRCPKCGEPWDTDCIHDVIVERFGTHVPNTYQERYHEIAAEFRKDGCKVFGGRCTGNVAHPAVAAIMELMGDDVDGAAAMLEDMEAMGFEDTNPEDW